MKTDWVGGVDDSNPELATTLLDSAEKNLIRAEVEYRAAIEAHGFFLRNYVLTLLQQKNIFLYRTGRFFSIQYSDGEVQYELIDVTKQGEIKAHAKLKSGRWSKSISHLEQELIKHMSKIEKK